MEWWKWILLIVGSWFGMFIIIRLIVALRRRANVNHYRSEYYGR